ncbi:MAG TPA: hypothetical protein VM074_11670 [Solimonas sp.]|nr:hypothetical protein [Solimonas sp.]
MQNSLRHIAPMLALLLCACGGGNGDEAAPAAGFDPMAKAMARGLLLVNKEAPVPPQCYTKTDGVANPCWVCHTESHGRNQANDQVLQESYAFSEFAQTNRWENLFKDRSAAIAAIGDDQALAYIRQDNYTPLMEAMRTRTDYYGWRPDLDYRQGFDAEGFARDGSWWRAFRYKPFLGTFWPTNGSTDDIIVRLAPPFYTAADGTPSRELYKINLAIMEAAMATPDTVARADVVRRVEPVSEDVAGIDLDGNGTVGGVVSLIHGLPANYLGNIGNAAHPRSAPVLHGQYPEGTEFLHTVRYVDPDRPNLLSTRMKEVRYAIKLRDLTDAETTQVYFEAKREKERGGLPFFGGTPQYGVHNELGWQYHAFIEDEAGRLRMQTLEEHYFCMGCHTNLGVTVDQTFGWPRKVPGAAGWGHESFAGIKDVAQAGQAEPEILTYFKRVGGGDEFRANTEMLDRFFPAGTVDEAAVRRAAPGGDQDIRFLLVPSRSRALQLDKAYMALVKEQTFELGRDAVISPPGNVHPHIDNGDTGLVDGNGIYGDGRLWPDWGAP